MTDQTISWLRDLAAKGGKGVVNNIDARCLGRVADELERLSRPAQRPLATIQAAADEVVSRVCEWDDRTSPDDFPEALLITPSELHRELVRFAEDIGALSPAQQPRSTALNEIAAERQRQISKEGWTPEHDDNHRSGEMAIAAGWYALNSPFVGHHECIGDPSKHGHEAYRLFSLNGLAAMRWPWSLEWWRPKNTRHDLVRAAALIVAEIERLDRAALPSTDGGGK